MKLARLVRGKRLMQPILFAEPKLRPLKRGEQVERGAAVQLAGDPARIAYTFHDWQPCGGDRFALLDAPGDTRGHHVAAEHLLRITGDTPPRRKRRP